MVILLLIILLIVLIISKLKKYIYVMETVGMIFIICLIVAGFLTGYVVNGDTLNAKIEMYIEENQKIEDSINLLVKQYMDYESDIYGELNSENIMSLISLYPELKADSLVMEQINIYTSNNDKIKELKEKYLDIINYRWWLYFGK